MNIGDYTFNEFRQLAENFHGYAAPGLLVGGYMVEKARKELPKGTLFESVVESAKCLPDAVQLLTPCSIGNQRLKILNLGRYALSLFDKYSGHGVRVSLDAKKMSAWPELYAWFFKKKPKREQDSARLEAEIENAGDSFCVITPITIQKRFIGHTPMHSIGLCPVCGEAYPQEDGDICRGCQGEAPYQIIGSPQNGDTIFKNPVRVVPVQEAVGQKVAHDMTRIEPGQFKGPEFKEGHRISPSDLCRLQSMGRFNIAVKDHDEAECGDGLVHENMCAKAFAKYMAGNGITYKLPPSEGKIDFMAEKNGLFHVNKKLLLRFNLIPMVMAACRNDFDRVKIGDRLAGTRAIPLYLPKEIFEQAIDVLKEEPMFEVLPLRHAKTGILVTGTEVFKGLIEDKFIPIISSKVKNLECDVIMEKVVPDDKNAIASAVEEMKQSGIDLLITTGGLSVDPDDITRQTLMECGLENIVHGIPVLPGTMSLVGKIKNGQESIDVLGVPACALYFKTTFFDLVLPRILAALSFERLDAANMAEGGYCLSCKTCTWPKCGFGK